MPMKPTPTIPILTMRTFPSIPGEFVMMGLYEIDCTFSPSIGLPLNHQSTEADNLRGNRLR